MIIADQDKVVCNERSRQIHELMKTGGNGLDHRLEEIKNVDHNPMADGLQFDSIFEKIDQYFTSQ